MIKKLLLLFFVTLRLPVVACRRGEDGLEPGRQAKLPQELVVPSGATDIRSKESPDFQRLTYFLSVVFPARAVIQNISKELSSHGYCPLKNNYFNQDDTASFERGWIKSIMVKSNEAADAKGHFISSWWAQWVNNNGDVMDVALSYYSPSEKETNTEKLFVSLSRLPAPAAKKLIEKMPKYPERKLSNLIYLPCDASPNTELAFDNPRDPRIYEVRPPRGYREKENQGGRRD